MKLSKPLQPGVPRGFEISRLAPQTQALLRNARFVHRMHDLMALFLRHPFVQYWPIDPGTGADVMRAEILEATVIHTLSGPVVNFPEKAMRKRDPNATMVTSAFPISAQGHLHDRYCEVEWAELNRLAHEWLAKHAPIAVPIRLFRGTPATTAGVVILPENCAFFGYMMGILQEILSAAQCSEGLSADFVVLLAPPLRHSHFDGRQAVIHHRYGAPAAPVYEMLATCLYPGPSGKKGVYAMGLEIARRHDGVILHASAVRLLRPDGSHISVLHEGASGGGKSEWILTPDISDDGMALVSRHVESKQEIRRALANVSESGLVHPVVDDMALAFTRSNQLMISDAEHGWFLRLDNATEPGADVFCEYLAKLPIAHRIWLSVEPGLFARPWLRTADPGGDRDKNGRMMIGRRYVPNYVDHAVKVDIRSLGIRTPHCFDPAPFGIVGFCHYLPWWLAYLWRLAPPRGHDNPSIAAGAQPSADDDFVLPFEGVGAYEAFLLGDPVDHANLLLRQFAETAGTITNILVPNQHVGAYQVGFAPQHFLRAHLCLGGTITPGDWAPCALLGQEIEPFAAGDGEPLPDVLFRPHRQPELRDGRYERGRAIVERSLRAYLPRYLQPHLHPVAARLIRAVVDGEDLTKLAVSPEEALG